MVPRTEHLVLGDAALLVDFGFVFDLFGSLSESHGRERLLHVVVSHSSGYDQARLRVPAKRVGEESKLLSKIW